MKKAILLFSSLTILSGCATMNETKTKIASLEANQQLTIENQAKTRNDMSTLNDNQMAIAEKLREIQNLLQQQTDLTKTLALVDYKIVNHLEYVKKKLCGVTIIGSQRGIDIVPENGFPMPKKCKISKILNKDELRTLESYLK